jgi:hypothetical protein
MKEIFLLIMVFKNIIQKPWYSKTMSWFQEKLCERSLLLIIYLSLGLYLILILLYLKLTRAKTCIVFLSIFL